MEGKHARAVTIVVAAAQRRELPSPERSPSTSCCQDVNCFSHPAPLSLPTGRAGLLLFPSFARGRKCSPFAPCSVPAAVTAGLPTMEGRERDGNPHSDCDSSDRYSDGGQTRPRRRHYCNCRRATPNRDIDGTPPVSGRAGLQPPPFSSRRQFGRFPQVSRKQAHTAFPG